MPEDIDDTINLRQSQHAMTIASALRDITSDPLKKAMEERLQKLIVENIEVPFSKPDQNLKSQTCKEYVSIYEKISPGEIYIIRIIDNGVDIIENHDGNAIYKRIKLSL